MTLSIHAPPRAAPFEERVRVHAMPASPAPNQKSKPSWTPTSRGGAQTRSEPV